jgi:hypothetical protein
MSQLFMVVERMLDPDAVYARFAEKGRMLPDGVEYVNSWVEPDRSRCFQLMQCRDRAGLEEWAAHWRDIVEFEFVPVITSAEAAALSGD